MFLHLFLSRMYGSVTLLIDHFSFIVCLCSWKSVIRMITLHVTVLFCHFDRVCCCYVKIIIPYKPGIGRFWIRSSNSAVSAYVQRKTVQNMKQMLSDHHNNSFLTEYCCHKITMVMFDLSQEKSFPWYFKHLLSKWLTSLTPLFLIILMINKFWVGKDFLLQSTGCGKIK